MTETVTLVYDGPQDAVEVQLPTGGWLVFERGVPIEAVPAVLAYGGPAVVSVLDGTPLGSELAGLLTQGDEIIDPETGDVTTAPYWRVIEARAPRGRKAEPDAEPEDS